MVKKRPAMKTPVVLKLFSEGDTPILRNNNTFDTIYEW